MKISLDWIRQYVSLPDDLDCDELAHNLTMATVEVEGVERLADSLAGLIIAKVDDVEKHPDADKLVVAKCDVGKKKPAQIVCGGTNVEKGMLVALAPPGTMVNWHGKEQKTEIVVAKVRGVESEGMICAPSEIGLATLFECPEKEILDLSDFDAKPGTPLVEALDLDDIILEIDNKSLTNRPDLWGHYGLARELAVIYGKELKPIPPLDLGDAPVNERVISQVDECRRFTETKISGVSVEPSPFWLRSRLARVGQRPINLLVDLTNYVLLGIGQPTHAFDGNRIKGDLHVRFATKKDKLQLLDESELALKKTDLVVCDEDGPVALAGIMGGAERSVCDDTTDIIFECANFDAVTIRRASTRLDARTESSSRFEKSLDPELVPTGVAMFVSMLQELQPDAKVTSFIDHYPGPIEPQPIEITQEFLDWRLGEKIAPAKVDSYLKTLGFAIDRKKKSIKITPPTWRSTGDITLPEDIVEEIARLHGYESFEFFPPQISLRAAINQTEYRVQRAIKEYLATTASMQEIFSYPWVEDQFLDAAGIKKEDCLEISSPPAPNICRLQPSLIPQLLRATVDNLRYHKDFRLFELTRVFRPLDKKAKKKAAEKLPLQPKLASGVFVGADPKQLFLQAKGALDGLIGNLRVGEISFKPTSDVAWADANAQMTCSIGDQEIGSLGVVSRFARIQADIKHAHVAAFELEFDALLSIASSPAQFEHIPELPHVEYDLSMIFDASTTWGEVNEVAEKCHDLIKQVSFVDEYAGKGIEDNKKSLTLRLLLGSEEGTLTSAQADEAAGAVTKSLTKKFDAVLRA